MRRSLFMAAILLAALSAACGARKGRTRGSRCFETCGDRDFFVSNELTT